MNPIYNYYSNNFEEGKVIAALHKDFVCHDSPDCYISRVLDGIDVEKADVICHPTKKKNDSDIGDVLLIHLKSKNKSAVMDAIEKLSANPYVVYAEPDYLVNTLIIPNDPYFGDLWGVEKIKAPLAWNYTTGSADVVVGVLDSGIDSNHPDIKDNMWVFENNKHIHGRNFVEDSDNSTDETGHGTHVAGTIGAVGNNFIGITGVCWNVKVAALRIGDVFIDLAAAIAAVDYASINHIPILNNSWGGSHYSPILKFAIEQYDGLFIASAGNSGDNSDFFPLYPAAYDCDNIISVAATNQNDTLASFSNYGVKSVDIAAPGTHILSTDLNHEYSYKNGTSMSSPHVAGAAALLKAYRPDFTAADMKNIILSSAKKLPDLYDKVLTGGILNVNAMIEMAEL